MFLGWGRILEMRGKEDGTTVYIDRWLITIKAMVAFMLCATIAALGPLTYLMLQSAEIDNFLSTFQAISQLMEDNITGTFQRKITTSKLIVSLLVQGIETSGSAYPNFTLSNFEQNMGPLATIADFRYVAFHPLVDQSERLKWEAYARQNNYLLKGPPGFNVSVNGSWVVGDGMYNVTSSGVRSYAGPIIGDSPFPTSHFPVWQIAPIFENVGLINLDSHSVLYQRRKAAIDDALTQRKPVMTDFVYLLQDGFDERRPSTITYNPIFNYALDNIGLISTGFTWDELLSGILQPGFGLIYCVVTRKSISYTFGLIDASAVLIGKGSLFDPVYEEHRRRLNLSVLGLDYELAIYPSKRMYGNYVNDTPRNMCIIVVLTISSTAFIVFLYGYLIKVRNARLQDRIKHSFAAATARDAVLLSKKVYIRYMSHEMRTPLNVVHLGLRILERNLQRFQVPQSLECISTVRDIMSACEIAVVFLNDLLNFGKLEDGYLSINPRKMRALPFFVSTTKLFTLQAEEKGIRLEIDCQDFNCAATESSFPCYDSNNIGDEKIAGSYPSPVPGSGIDTCLSNQFIDQYDYIDIDNQKMAQVIRNMICNAIKYSPEGGVVRVKARKATYRRPVQTAEDHTRVDIEKSDSHIDISRSDSSSPFCKCMRRVLTKIKSPCTESNRGGGCCGGDIERGSRSAINEQSNLESQRDEIPRASNTPVQGVTYEMLVIDVIDSGVGMSHEALAKIFSNSTDFDPSELQPGQGSGLGSIIVKAIVKLHGGKINVRTDGVGRGCVFTLQLPLSSPPDPLSVNILTPTNGTVSPVSAVESEDVHVNVDEEIAHFHEFTPNSSGAAIGGGNGGGKWVNSPTYAEASTPRKELKFLVVDDSALNRKMVLKLLSNHVCDQAEDGDDAVRKFSQRLSALSASQNQIASPMTATPTAIDENSSGSYDSNIGIPFVPLRMYDAILMDFMMPNMDGPTATALIREMGYKGLIIGITGNALKADIEYFLARGANQVLIKPVNVEALDAIMARLCDQSA